MTGKAGLQNATNKEEVEESETEMQVTKKLSPPVNLPQSPFLTKLDTLTKKIHLYQDIFAKRQPLKMKCDDVLKKQSLSFEKFKLLYGNPDERGVRTLKVGNQTFEVDSINYKYKKAAVDTHRSVHHY